MQTPSRVRYTIGRGGLELIGRANFSGPDQSRQGLHALTTDQCRGEGHCKRFRHSGPTAQLRVTGYHHHHHHHQGVAATPTKPATEHVSARWHASDPNRETGVTDATMCLGQLAHAGRLLAPARSMISAPQAAVAEHYIVGTPTGRGTGGVGTGVGQGCAAREVGWTGAAGRTAAPSAHYADHDGHHHNSACARTGG